MIQFDWEKCIGCGKCQADCFPGCIQMVAGRPEMQGDCLECGHCVAVCPVNAVTMAGYDLTEVLPYDEASFTVDAESLLNMIKFRRSTRQFLPRPVEEDQLLRMIEAGRFTATGKNRQGTGYLVVREKLPQLRALLLASLKRVAEQMLAGSCSPQEAKQAQRWQGMYAAYEGAAHPVDQLFFEAPAVILVTAETTVGGLRDAALAASHMELMAYAQGLGMLYSGYSAMAANASPDVRQFLGLADNQEVALCLVVGYPAVTYYRTVPRKKAAVTWL